eukprot:2994343-Pleurochrysis_carterae.AAC.3
MKRIRAGASRVMQRYRFILVEKLRQGVDVQTCGCTPSADFVTDQRSVVISAVACPVISVTDLLTIVIAELSQKRVHGGGDSGGSGGRDGGGGGGDNDRVRAHVTDPTQRLCPLAYKGRGHERARCGMRYANPSPAIVMMTMIMAMMLMMILVSMRELVDVVIRAWVLLRLDLTRMLLFELTLVLALRMVRNCAELALALLQLAFVLALMGPETVALGDGGGGTEREGSG